MHKVALIVASGHATSPLSPFFAKAYGVRLVSFAVGQEAESAAMPLAASAGIVIPNLSRTADEICDTVLRQGARYVLCGFVDRTSRERLEREGVKIVLAPCNQPALELIEAGFFDMS